MADRAANVKREGTHGSSLVALILPRMLLPSVKQFVVGSGRIQPNLLKQSLGLQEPVLGLEVADSQL
jgi:hypothetical protein